MDSSNVALVSRPPLFTRNLQPGLILEIARHAGVKVANTLAKQPICCPLHEDKHPSAFLHGARNIFGCSVCTPDGGWSARGFAHALKQPWPPVGLMPNHPPLRLVSNSAPPPFGPAEARDVWERAQARARDENHLDHDAAVYDYLRGRGLADARKEGAFGILAAGMALPAAVAGWPRTGHQLAVPLYDGEGQIANLQARAIRAAEKKTLFPFGSRAKGSVFASHMGLRVLRNEWTGPRRLVIGEGLTDFLALSITAAVPVLSVPGTSLAAPCVGPWIAGFDVLLALDADAAGGNAIAPAAEAAYRHGARRVRRVVWPGQVKDACAVIDERGVEALAAFLQRETEESADV